MNTIAHINIALEVFGSILSLIIILCLVTGRNKKDRLYWLFICLLLNNIIVLLSDAVTYMVEGSTARHSYIIVRVATFCAYSFRYVFLPLFIDYLITYIGIKAKSISRTAVYISVAACIVGILLIVVSQFNHMYYDFDEYNYYYRQNMFWLSQALGSFFMILSAAIILRHLKILKMRDAFFLLSYSFLPLLAMVIQIIYYGLALFDFAATLSLAAIYVGIQAEQSKRLKEKELELTEYRIATMLSQIQPHFLYNALSAIAQLCVENPEKAKDATIDFASYLRGNMDSLSDSGLISFQRELDHIEAYLNLEKAIYGSALKIIYNIKSENFVVPPLSVQPIVENAIKHGIGQREGGGTLMIGTRETDKEYLIVVSDDGMGFDTESASQNEHHLSGIGNVRERLLAQCGGTLEIVSKLGEGTAAAIRIPKDGDVTI